LKLRVYFKSETKTNGGKPTAKPRRGKNMNETKTYRKGKLNHTKRPQVGFFSF